MVAGCWWIICDGADMRLMHRHSRTMADAAAVNLAVVRRRLIITMYDSTIRSSGRRLQLVTALEFIILIFATAAGLRSAIARHCAGSLLRSFACLFCCSVDDVYILLVARGGGGRASDIIAIYNIISSYIISCIYY
jgi:hypothetical protein